MTPCGSGHDPLRDEMVDARDDIPRVADPEVAHVELTELLAVPRAAAVVRLEHDGPLRQPELDGIRAPDLHAAGTRDARRPAVNHDEQRVLLSRLEVRRLVQHPFDRRAVGALPRDHLACRPSSPDLISKRREFSRSHRRDICDMTSGTSRIVRNECHRRESLVIEA
jgi:hypothetical protein